MKLNARYALFLFQNWAIRKGNTGPILSNRGGIRSKWINPAGFAIAFRGIPRAGSQTAAEMIF